MKNPKSIKLSDYVEYPFFIPSIFLDFNICKDYVLVISSMIIKPKSLKSSKLILQGNKIKLLSIEINQKELATEEYIVSENQILIDHTPLSEFELKIKSEIDPYKNTSLEGLY